MRIALLLLAATLVGCAAEPTAVNAPNQSPVLSVGGSNAGGVTFAAGSGCTLVLSHFECSFTVQGVGSDAYSISQRGLWTYTYQCVHRKTFKPSRTPPASGTVSAIILQTLTGTNGEITVSGTVLAPEAPTDCAANKGAYTVTQLLTALTPASWSLYAAKVNDPDNYYASLFEVL